MACQKAHSGVDFQADCTVKCIYIMRYEWDERKNRENQRKHAGISFELAMLVFEDEHRLISLDRVDETGELRWHAIGAVFIQTRDRCSAACGSCVQRGLRWRRDNPNHQCATGW